jgi:pimeloyl-ACP methyl ester carboxylesterase
MRTFFWSPRYTAPDEDELISEVLLTRVGEDYYPGGSTPSENWPGVAPAPRGVNNAMSPAWCNTSGFGDVARPAPVLWIRGDEDPVVSDASMFDFGTLGRLGVVPGWPGDEVYPPQPMIAQSRGVFERRHVREVVLHEVGHGPHIERPAEVARLMLEHIGAER